MSFTIKEKDIAQMISEKYPDKIIVTEVQIDDGNQGQRCDYIACDGVEDVIDYFKKSVGQTWYLYNEDIFAKAQPMLMIDDKIMSVFFTTYKHDGVKYIFYDRIEYVKVAEKIKNLASE